MISQEEVKEAVINGKMIEDYSQDTRGPSYLILGKTNAGRNLHVVCAPKNEYLLIITSYVPNPAEWDIMFKKRKR